MWHKLPAFPEPLRAVLSRLPHYPPSAAFATLLTLQLAEHISVAALPELADKKIKLRIQDVGVTLLFQAGPDGFFACSNGEADLTITATAQDFLSLALRREDPDTLFFSRRLLMEGDTELGLLLKNTLDGMGNQAFEPKHPTFLAIINALKLQIFQKHLRPSLHASQRDRNLI
ncbi:MAG: SCP2 sterol-binding domain-containing protein [Burkholderiales bacterium]|nr:SCP2 sterol-binding domain-containing protein [Burkholderiales bacterium]